MEPTRAEWRISEQLVRFAERQRAHVVDAEIAHRNWVKIVERLNPVRLAAAESKRERRGERNWVDDDNRAAGKDEARQALRVRSAKPKPRRVPKIRGRRRFEDAAAERFRDLWPEDWYNYGWSRSSDEQRAICMRWARRARKSARRAQGAT